MLIGGGARAAKYEAIVKERELENFYILPFQHGEYSLDEIYGAGDLHFISLRPSCTGLGVPSKAYNSLAAGRPIVYFGSSESEIARMVTEDEVGSAVTNVQELEEAVLSYVEDAALREAHGLNARAISEGNYSRANAMYRYKKVLEGRSPSD